MPKLLRRSILVPVDLSDTAAAGVRVGKQLGRRWESSLFLVHVPEALPSYRQRTDPEVQAARRKLRAKLAARVRSLSAGYPEDRLRILESVRRTSIEEFLARPLADLIVMGTHGRTGLSRLTFGSAAEAVVHVASVPVLAVRSGVRRLEPRRILVPTNFTPHAAAAADAAAELARDFGAELILLHASEKGGTGAVGALRAAAAALDAPKIRTKRVLGRPDERILREAEGADLLVLSAHRRRVWKDWLIGSTAERLLRHSPTPVLTLPSVR